ncbi:thioredoxin [Perkinsela sp. CCAP 1560/4]|nr:thioredoxin [Perkinsela sp. CCAP 1560/4]|eukprot:KNH04990.1 thioredoxin [Perkinsela sp. CCAP 1560/4]
MGGLPHGTQSVNVSDIQLHGNIVLGADLSILKHFAATGNKLSGRVDFTSLPEAIRSLRLGKNEFSGSCDLSCLSAQLISLGISENNFSQKFGKVFDYGGSKTCIGL